MQKVVEHSRAPFTFQEKQLFALEEAHGNTFVAWTPAIIDADGLEIAEVKMFSTDNFCQNMHTARANVRLFVEAPILLKAVEDYLEAEASGDKAAFERDALMAIIAEVRGGDNGTPDE